MPNSSSPIHPLLGRLIAPLYSTAINTRNRRFDRGEGVARLPVPIISVGNLSVGGTGKTPMVALLVRELRAAGLHPCIAMRGYQPRRAKRSAAPGLSDEAELYRHTFPDLPLVAQPDRTAGLRRLLAGRSADPSSSSGGAAPIDCVILDDGFQHRQLARDLDIVLIDASRSPFDDNLLPRGWLREPPSSLKRASAVVITHAELATPDALDRLTSQITRAHGKPPIAATRHVWSSLAVLDPLTGADTQHDAHYLRDRRTLAVCAIGNPTGFFAAVRSAMTDPQRCTTMPLPDHDPFGPSTVAAIARAAAEAKADLIVTTQKDWTKLARLPASTWPCPIARPTLDLAFDRGREALLALALAAARSSPATTDR